jgi:hypothetical protein
MLRVAVEARQVSGSEGVKTDPCEQFCRSRGPTQWMNPFGGRPQIDPGGFVWLGRS